jgi:hypothetical protein
LWILLEEEGKAGKEKEKEMDEGQGAGDLADDYDEDEEGL